MTWSPENKERMHIGAAIADRLDQRKSPVEVAAIIGVSTTRLRQIECIALWKIAQRMQEITGREIMPDEVQFASTAFQP